MAKQTKFDEVSLSMMRYTLAALKQLVGRVTKEYLPGGKFSSVKDDPSFREETRSTPKHNKLPERLPMLMMRMYLTSE